MTMQTFVVLSMLIAMGVVAHGTFVCEKDGMFENTNDRGTFWHCAHGIGYLKQCPATLVWSQQLQECDWNVVTPTVAVTSTQPVTTTVTTAAPSLLPAQCSTYTSITDGTRRPNNTLINDETDHSYFNSTPRWVRFEGAAGTQLADYSVPANRCGSEGAGWLKHPEEVDVGETVKQTACFNWGGVSCIWPVKVPMTNCDGFFVYALVAPALRNGRYCTI